MSAFVHQAGWHEGDDGQHFHVLVRCETLDDVPATIVKAIWGRWPVDLVFSQAETHPDTTAALQELRKWLKAPKQGCLLELTEALGHLETAVTLIERLSASAPASGGRS